MQESSDIIITRPGDLQQQNLELIQAVQSTKGQQIISCSISQNRKYILTTTQKGFLIVYISKPTTFKRFQREQSPFFVNQKHPCGVKLGFIFQQKPQVALMPAFTSKKYKQTSIYIYNYSAKIILTIFDMVLPIKQFKMTQKHIVCSNDKRILVYNYLQSPLIDDEKFYLYLHQSKENVDFIRYLEMKCHRCNQNQYQNCQSGRFQLAREMKIYLKLFFVKVQRNKSNLSKRLYIYDEISQQVRPFEQINTLSDDFIFKVSEDGKYMLIAEDYHRKIKVFNIEDNCNFISLLYLSRDPGEIINLGVIKSPIKGQYVVASREKGGDQATMHLFQLKSTSLIEPLQSKYKRYFRLYKKDTMQKHVFAQNIGFLGPEYYMVEGKLICLSMEGEECQLIDLNRTGLHDRANASSYLKIQETV